jgi:hypothetical protein
MAACTAVRIVREGIGAGAAATRLAAGTVAVRSGARGITIRIGRVAFAAVAALEDAEVVEIHVAVPIKQGIGARRGYLRNRWSKRALFEVSEIRSIDIAVVIEVAPNHRRPGLTHKQAGEHRDRQDDATAGLTVH